LSRADDFERVRVVLVATRNPLNIGAVARAMSNFGLAKLRVVNPFEPSFREAQSAVGASHILRAAEEFTSVAEAVGDCSLVIGTTTGRDRDVAHAIKSLEVAAPEIRAHLQTGNIALLFGSEKRGLSNDDLAHCQRLVRIPTREEHPSMNLGQAVAVCLYEIVRTTVGQNTHASFARVGHQAIESQLIETTVTSDALKKILATSAELERLTRVLLECLRWSDYVKSKTDAATQDNVRRLVRRLNLSAADAELLLGMLRKIARTLGAENK
jgi:TrmH family RNA methyltransferase